MAQPVRSAIVVEWKQVIRNGFNTSSRLDTFTNDHWRGLLAKSLQSACQEEQFLLIAFVFMPERVHLLVLPQAERV